ncbi:hypothetical protein ARMSODRAFT_981780 [Armillaria solidipes]|uniref:Uncharacterized protein n=1 Tax=Armillaria solidipes TaxID=1076256 RepID=A0A2H3B4W8_9AGAR|nr:hypothetical protein ARMSODRAFT_981780 [Armillaria solidipes]
MSLSLPPSLPSVSRRSISTPVPSFTDKPTLPSPATPSAGTTAPVYPPSTQQSPLHPHPLPLFLREWQSLVFASTGFMLGKSATAVWMRRQDHDNCQTLVAAVYLGPLNLTAEVRVRDLCSNPLNNRRTLDYNEELGRITLGSTSGRDITVIQL